MGSLEDLRDDVWKPQPAQDEPVSSDVTDGLVFSNLEAPTEPSTLRDIADQVATWGHLKPEWVEKMLHPLPEAAVANRRADFILEACRSKRVLNLGSASGGLHDAIKTVASEVVGVDREEGADYVCDLDKEPDNLYRWLGTGPPFDLIVAGEVIEHLCNPGRLLDALRMLMTGTETKLLITVPNASGRGYQYHDGRLHEIVNSDHCFWFSWKTLACLADKCGLYVLDGYWYNGQPPNSEGIIFICEPRE